MACSAIRRNLLKYSGFGREGCTDAGLWLPEALKNHNCNTVKRKAKENVPDMIRRHYVFYGGVQGVGFRWRAQQAAKLYGLTGWVRNDWEGTVTMELQGEASLLDKVVVILENSNYIRIDRIEAKDLPPDPKERRFSTDYGW